MRNLMFSGRMQLLGLGIIPGTAAEIGLCRFDTRTLSFHGTVQQWTKCLILKVEEALMASASTSSAAAR
ncbi:hypothetical protein NKJ74_26930 [Mesorhizobium sp. M0046]|uniref:hypothetical protein n=1 Tax=Mesorhizobium sp. M0046 TaxID=2956858 RepID=UPI00333A0B42